MEHFEINDPIAAISTPPGKGGIAVIRISGKNVFPLVNSAWKGSDLTKVDSHTLHLGKYFTIDGTLLDECVASVFYGPNSFTGEDTIELNVHGSTWIQKEIINDLVCRGVRIADPGEFTKRAFMNGKLDLAQAEGIADLISSSSQAAHAMAINQTKGIFSKEFKLLREKLIEFASLLELELDFSEEDVEFADREKLILLCDAIIDKIQALASTYKRGTAIKDGVPVVIAGQPNVGKSSLLNMLLNDDKAIVTDLPGTTRDIIEDTVEIEGINYRFIDTAGLRDTVDLVEGIGIKKANDALEKAFIIIWVIDASKEIIPQLILLNEFIDSHIDKNIIILINKSDLIPFASVKEFWESYIKVKNQEKQIEIENNKIHKESILFSTKDLTGFPDLLNRLNTLTTGGKNLGTDIMLTNARHFESLTKALTSLKRSREALRNNLSGDFISQDIREAISHLSSITGSITNDNLLHSIFSRFCIGK